jgi:hypothetical protein
VNSARHLVGFAAVSVAIGGIAGPLVLAAEIGRVQFEYDILIVLYALSVFVAGAAMAGVAALLLTIGRAHWPQVWPFVVVGTCLAVATFGSCQIAERFSVGCAELQARGDQLVGVIEQSRSATGSYPDTLQALGINMSPTRFGPWRYGRKDSGFYLSVGDYTRDALELTYTSAQGWYCDT